MNGRGAPLWFALGIIGLWVGARSWWLIAHSLSPPKARGPLVQLTPRPVPPQSGLKPDRPAQAARYPGFKTSRPPQRRDQIWAPRPVDQRTAWHPVQQPEDTPALAAPPPPAGSSRWRSSAWIYLRPGRQTGLAPAGLLGGSQAGFRLEQPLTDRLDASLRLTHSLGTHPAGEAALGLSLHDPAAPGLALLVERRVELGGEGRSAFAALLAGGFWHPARAGHLLLDGYGQLGMVGLHRRDPFADGMARIAVPLVGPDGPRLGLGAWAAAQPGVARLDLGPHLAVPLALGPQQLTLALDARFRVAGRAAPRSGIALTLSGDFAQ